MWILEVKRPGKSWKLFAKYVEEEKAEEQLRKFRKKRDGNEYRLIEKD